VVKDQECVHVIFLMTCPKYINETGPHLYRALRKIAHLGATAQTREL